MKYIFLTLTNNELDLYLIKKCIIVQSRPILEIVLVIIFSFLLKHNAIYTVSCVVG